MTLQHTTVRIISADRIFARMLTLELADVGINATAVLPNVPEPRGRQDIITVADADTVNTDGLSESPSLIFGWEGKSPDETACFFLRRPFHVDEFVRRILELMADTADSKEKKPSRPAVGMDTAESSGGQGLVFDQNTSKFRFNGSELELTEKEHALLALLYQNRGKPVSREEILRIVWGRDCESQPPKTNLTDVYIRYLRSKIDDRFSVRCI